MTTFEKFMAVGIVLQTVALMKVAAELHGLREELEKLRKAESLVGVTVAVKALADRLADYIDHQWHRVP